jgi:hypothetical protein
MLNVDYRLRKIWIIQQQICRYKVEEKLRLGVHEQKWLNNTVLDNRFSDGGKAVSLTPRTRFIHPTHFPEWFLVLISVKRWVKPWAMVRLEGLGKLKNIQ